MSAPTFQALGPIKATGADATVQWPAHQTGDVGLLMVETANEGFVSPSPQGFALIIQFGTGVAGAAGAVRLGVYWCRATSGSMASPVITDPGDHIIARIATFRGCIGTGDPWDVTANDVQAVANTAVVIPGATTTLADCLIVAIVANAIDTVTDGQTSGWTNAALTSLTERDDWNADPNVGGGLAFATGIKATAGATGSTTATLLTASMQARMMIALKSGGTAPGPMPVFQAAGTKVESLAATASPAWPAHLENDIAILAIESADEAITLSTPAGFAAVADSPQGQAATGPTRLTLYWCRATSSAMANPVIAALTDHTLAQIFTIRGCITTGNPWDVTAGDTVAPAIATVTVPGDTTTLDNCLVMGFVADARDQPSAQYSGWANADLSSLTEVADTRTVLGNGGGLGVVRGGKATAGAYGVTTATLAGISVQGRISIAFKPVPGSGGGGGGGGGGGANDGLPHRYWRARLANTPGAGPEVNQVELVERVGVAAVTGTTVIQPAQLHPSITHFQPMFRANQGSDANAVFDLDLMLVTVPAGYSPDIPTDQVTRRVDTFYDDDGVLRPGVGQNDGAGSLPLVKGLIRGTARHGDEVVFSEFGRVFQIVPQVTFAGGILHQPASKWGTAAQVDAGTASSAPSTSNPQYEDFGADALNESGFTCRARLRQKGTITNRTLNFAGTVLDTVGETDTISTLTNAPASNDMYIINTFARCRLRSSNGALFRVFLVLVIESTIDSGATWQVRGGGTFDFQTTNLVFQDQGSSGAFFFTLSGLTSDGTDRIRLKLNSISTSGLGEYDTANTNWVGSTVTFTTSSDTYASKTPAADDVVTWEAKGFV